MSNELEKLNEEIKQNEVNELKSVISEIHSGIVNMENPKVPAIVFKTQFADYFKNIKSFDPSAPLVMKWLYISGNAYTPVDLINEKAEVVDTVPALYARPIIDSNMENKNFSDILTTYENKTNVMAVVGKNYLVGALADVSGLVKGNTESAELEWSRILNKYSDKPLIETTKETKTVETKKTIPDDGFNYD